MDGRSLDAFKRSQLANSEIGNRLGNPHLPLFPSFPTRSGFKVSRFPGTKAPNVTAIIYHVVSLRDLIGHVRKEWLLENS